MSNKNINVTNIILKYKDVNDVDNIKDNMIETELLKIQYNKQEIQSLIDNLNIGVKQLNNLKDQIEKKHKILNNTKKYIFISLKILKNKFGITCIKFLNIQYNKITLKEDEGYLIIFDSIPKDNIIINNNINVTINCIINKSNKKLILSNIHFFSSEEVENIEFIENYCNIIILKI